MSDFDEAAKCKSCKGTGKQVFHGAFESRVGRCNFCGGHGTREEEVKWFNKSSKDRGLTNPLATTTSTAKVN